MSLHKMIADNNHDEKMREQHERVLSKWNDAVDTYNRDSEESSFDAQEETLSFLEPLSQ